MVNLFLRILGYRFRTGCNMGVHPFIQEIIDSTDLGLLTSIGTTLGVITGEKVGGLRASFKCLVFSWKEVNPASVSS